MPNLIVAPKNSWQRRVVDITCGLPDLKEDRPLLGCFVLAILGWQHGRTPPRFGRVARIDKDGIAYSNMQSKDGAMYRDFPLGPVKDISDNFRRLADEVQLEDKDRLEMFAELRKWFFVDARAKSEN